jgi:hypothetical protein
MSDFIRHFILSFAENFGLDPREVKVPTTRVVCDRCNGYGHHGNPSFDGTTVDWWLEGDDTGESFDNYMSGAYDVSCEECHGERVLDQLDEEAMSPEMLAEWESYCRAEYEDRAERDAERRMGC